MPAAVDTEAEAAIESKLSRLRFFTTHVRQTMARMRDARSGRDPLSMPQLALLEEHIATCITPVKARLVTQLRCGSLPLALDPGKTGGNRASICSASSTCSGGGGGGGSSGGASTGDGGGSTSRSSSVSSNMGGLGEGPSQDGGQGAEGGGYVGEGVVSCSVGMELNGHIFGAASSGSSSSSSSSSTSATGGVFDAVSPFGEREQKKRDSQEPSWRGSGGVGRVTERLSQHRRDHLDILSQLEAEGVFAADDSYSPCRAGLDGAASTPFMLPGTPYARDEQSPCDFSRELPGGEVQRKVEGYRPFSARVARAVEGQQARSEAAAAEATPSAVKRELWADERPASSSSSSTAATAALSSPSPPTTSSPATGTEGGDDAAAAVRSAHATVPAEAAAATTTTTKATNASTTLTEDAALSSSAGVSGPVQRPTPSAAAVSYILPKQEPVQAQIAYPAPRLAHGASVAATAGVAAHAVAVAAAPSAALATAPAVAPAAAVVTAVVGAEVARTPPSCGASVGRANAAAPARASGITGVAFSAAYQGQTPRSRPVAATTASGECATCVASGGGCGGGGGAAPALPAPRLAAVDKVGGGGGGAGIVVAPRQAKRRRLSAFPAALLQPREVRYQCGACSESYTATVTGNPWWLLVRQECQACHRMQIPRVDILNPTNNVGGHIAFLTEACAEVCYTRA